MLLSEFVAFFLSVCLEYCEPVASTVFSTVQGSLHSYLHSASRSDLRRARHKTWQQASDGSFGSELVHPKVFGSPCQVLWTYGCLLLDWKSEPEFFAADRFDALSQETSLGAIR
jgi:hypothetical protein